MILYFEKEKFFTPFVKVFYPLLSLTLKRRCIFTFQNHHTWDVFQKWKIQKNGWFSRHFRGGGRFFFIQFSQHFRGEFFHDFDFSNFFIQFFSKISILPNVVISEFFQKFLFFFWKSSITYMWWFQRFFLTFFRKVSIFQKIGDSQVWWFYIFFINF